MTTNRWHINRTETALTLSRCSDVRWDIAVQAVLPPVRKARLAHQIRQDMWRKLQTLRGFCPAVRVEEDGAHLRITAGGDIASRSFPKTRAEEQIKDLFEDSARVARWLRHAKQEVAHA